MGFFIFKKNLESNEIIQKPTDMSGFRRFFLIAIICYGCGKLKIKKIGREVEVFSF